MKIIEKLFSILYCELYVFLLRPEKINEIMTINQEHAEGLEAEYGDL